MIVRRSFARLFCSAATPSVGTAATSQSSECTASTSVEPESTAPTSVEPKSTASTFVEPESTASTSVEAESTASTSVEAESTASTSVECEPEAGGADGESFGDSSGGTPRLGLFKPASRIKLRTSIGRDLQPFYVRLREIERTQKKEQPSPWSEELARSEKLFQFPIDNERLKWKTVERDVTFADHIDFDEYLEWVPTDGPVAAFMDLIALGLARNHTMTVVRKREVLINFRNHFANYLHDDHLFPAHDLERCKAVFAQIGGETPLLSSFIEESDLPLAEKGVGRIPTPYVKKKKLKKKKQGSV